MFHLWSGFLLGARDCVDVGSGISHIPVPEQRAGHCSPTTGTKNLSVALHICEPHPSLSPLALPQLIPHMPATFPGVCWFMQGLEQAVGMWLARAGREDNTTCIHSPLGQVGR